VVICQLFFESAEHQAGNRKAVYLEVFNTSQVTVHINVELLVIVYWLLGIYIKKMADTVLFAKVECCVCRRFDQCINSSRAIPYVVYVLHIKVKQLRVIGISVLKLYPLPPTL
jgi:hypothetical protein